jgi:hypothetical protein
LIFGTKPHPLFFYTSGVGELAKNARNETALKSQQED